MPRFIIKVLDKRSKTVLHKSIAFYASQDAADRMGFLEGIVELTGIDASGENNLDLVRKAAEATKTAEDEQAELTVTDDGECEHYFILERRKVAGTDRDDYLMVARSDCGFGKIIGISEATGNVITQKHRSVDENCMCFIEVRPWDPEPGAIDDLLAHYSPRQLAEHVLVLRKLNEK